MTANTTRTIFTPHMGGNVITHFFPSGYQINLALHNGTAGHDSGYWEAMIMRPTESLDT